MKLRKYLCWILGHSYKRTQNYPFSDAGRCVYCGDAILFTSKASSGDIVKAEKILREQMEEGYRAMTEEHTKLAELYFPLAQEVWPK